MRVETLPIDEVLPEIVSLLFSAGSIVLTAQPGAGKTTRVPPAMLDAGLANLPNKQQGQIVVLQPRRVAARAAAARMSEERGSELGAEIGYQVRHEGRFSRKTRILVCTEGVFLRRLQNDPLLENVAAVVFDEFHERSLNSDLALAMVRQVQEEVRPDLRIMVMSATLDTTPIASYLRNCPVVASHGRTYPVDVQYLGFPPSESIEKVTFDGVEQMLSSSDGHLLVFLPGVGEIRRTQDLLERSASAGSLAIMPLYGDLPLEQQQRVLHPSSERKIVLATNVAETSITIDGVTAVVDSGYARVNRFDPQLSLNRLGLERIAKSSADQRAGRAGRTAPGVCLRLWSGREHQMLPDFDNPEIARVELSECLLQLIAWGESDVRAFAWFEHPPANAINRALELLERLDALDHGSLTDTGRGMAQLPVQPRLARLLIEGHRLGHGKRAALCAALLSERDPFRRTGPPVRSEHHTTSDVLERVVALEDFDLRQHRNSLVGEILAGPAKRILQGSNQLLRLAGAATARPSGSESAGSAVIASQRQEQNAAPLVANSDEALLRALMVAFPDRICKRREPNGRKGLMVGGKGVSLAEESGVADGELFVAVEFIETASQSELKVRQASLVQRNWLPESQMQTSVDVEYDPGRRKVVALKRTRFCDLVIEEMASAIPADIDPGTIMADALASGADLMNLVDDSAKRYLARVRCLHEWLPELGLPDFSSEPWRELLPEWCTGCSSVGELTAGALIAAIQSRLTYEQTTAVELDAPDRLMLASGRQIQLDYTPGSPPVLAVRIQELFSMSDTPRIARCRVPVLLHLLAPNYRVQQITPDLASFWQNTYPQVKKELKVRYPRHAWPDNPLTAQPESAPKRRQV